MRGKVGAVHQIFAASSEWFGFRDAQHCRSGTYYWSFHHFIIGHVFQRQFDHQVQAVA
jgi:hypothetical protein